MAVPSGILPSVRMAAARYAGEASTSAVTFSSILARSPFHHFSRSREYSRRSCACSFSFARSLADSADLL